MKSVTYRLLVNLSVSDLLITCLCGPVHVISSLVIGKDNYRESSHSADSHSVVLSIVRFLKLFRNIHIVWIPLYSVLCIVWFGKNMTKLS